MGVLLRGMKFILSTTDYHIVYVGLHYIHESFLSDICVHALYADKIDIQFVFREVQQKMGGSRMVARPDLAPEGFIGCNAFTYRKKRKTPYP